MASSETPKYKDRGIEMYELRTLESNLFKLLFLLFIIFSFSKNNLFLGINK